jgi:hypothetical protein
MSDDIAAQARRRTGAIVAVAALVLLVTAAAVAGLVVALGHRASPVSQPAPPGPGSTPAGYSSTAPAASAAPGSTASPAVGGLSWTTVAGAKVPVSGPDGPRDTSNGRARGFAHTPMGAVLAAAHISLRLSAQVGPAVFEPTLAGQVVGADQAALRQHLEDDYQSARAQLGAPYGAPAGQLYSTARGYRVNLVADTADVELLIEGPGKSGSVLIALTLHVRWVNNDWALVAPAGGDWNAAATVTTDPTQYTRFPNGG